MNCPENDGPPGAESLGTGMRKLILIVLGRAPHRQYREIQDEACVSKPSSDWLSAADSFRSAEPGVSPWNDRRLWL
jgi:hypothetical protein